MKMQQKIVESRQCCKLLKAIQLADNVTSKKCFVKFGTKTSILVLRKKMKVLKLRKYESFNKYFDPKLNINDVAISGMINTEKIIEKIRESFIKMHNNNKMMKGATEYNTITKEWKYIFKKNKCTYTGYGMNIMDAKFKAYVKLYYNTWLN